MTDRKAPAKEEPAVTDEQLARLAGLCEAATAAPWRAMRDGNQSISGRLVGASRVEGPSRPWNERYVVPYRELEEVVRFTDEDADLVAASRNLLPSIIAELQSRRSAAPWRGESGVATPQTAPHPSRAASLTAFAKDALQESWSRDSADMQEFGIQHGLLVEVAYDPETHGDVEDSQRGDLIYIYSDWFKEAIAAMKVESITTHEMGAQRSGATPNSQMAQSNDPARAEAALRECLDAMRADNPAEGWLEIIQRGEAALACSPEPISAGSMPNDSPLLSAERDEVIERVIAKPVAYWTTQDMVDLSLALKSPPTKG